MRRIILECKECGIKENIHVDYFSLNTDGDKSWNFFWLPNNIQCKRCFRVILAYVEEETN